MGEGTIVVLNGVPRAGKSSIADIFERDHGWFPLGVDSLIKVLPENLRPGIGLRPGGERPDLEPDVERLFLALYASARSQAVSGVNVVMDVGHHDSFSRSLGILPKCASLVADLNAYLIGVRCPISEIRRRRELTNMVCSAELLTRWENAVHHPGIYDLEVNTLELGAAECAEKIRKRLQSPPVAFVNLSTISG